jgi:sugar lactone lactonase YvrE
MKSNLETNRPGMIDWKSGFPFSVFRFPFSVFRFPFSVFRFPFSVHHCSLKTLFPLIVTLIFVLGDCGGGGSDPGPAGSPSDDPLTSYTVGGKVSTTDTTAFLSDADIELWQNGFVQVGPFNAEADGSYLISDIVPGMGFSLKVSLPGSVTFYSPRFIHNGAIKHLPMDLPLDRIPVLDVSARGTALSSLSLARPYDIVISPDGTTLFVADTNHHQILAVNTSNGSSTVLAGNGSAGSADGTGGSTGTATFKGPNGLGVGRVGGTLFVFVGDSQNHLIRKVDASTGAVTTVAGMVGEVGANDGLAGSAKFSSPRCIAVDGAGNLYVADYGNNRIRKISSSDGGVNWTVSTFAGSGVAGYADGPAASAAFSWPVDLVFDSMWNLYVVDNSNHRIRKITAGGTVSTIAGSTAGHADGDALLEAKFDLPRGLEIDGAGNLYVTENTHWVRKITPDGVVTTLLGDGLPTGPLNQPKGLAVDNDNGFYLADTYHDRIVRFDF